MSSAAGPMSSPRTDEQLGRCYHDIGRAPPVLTTPPVITLEPSPPPPIP